MRLPLTVALPGPQQSSWTPACVLPEMRLPAPGPVPPMTANPPAWTPTPFPTATVPVGSVPT
jgi:hypothetical protein